ncbi:hypothetical protein DXG03_002702 [Asterophora parasitica]|uniref:Nuclease Le1 n=1 Tax=Asterophora parasitica TaxID=117018 RepID=A0A9P7G857_9AGAR|nr:hypothetical protein DXG03_002702 [Asterophora parasitica]
MKIGKIFAFAFVAAAPGVYGWGAVGHHAVGYVAMNFLAPKALNFVQNSLGPAYNNSLGPAASWPDEIKSDPATWGWSNELHYVDALDDPPTSCSVDQKRDCANGKCILTAIANYTIRVADTRLDAEQRQQALKFLGMIPFVGDIGQPLHVENIAVGGNSISVKCNGKTSNLHSVWDSGLVNNLVAANYGNSETVWADALAARIKKGGAYASSASSWITCSSTTTTAKKSLLPWIYGLLDTQEIQPLECPLVWARESNKFDCSYVFSYANGTDLCTSDYYSGAVPIIETQIAKQGYRLAAWLNVIFDGSTKLPLK